MTKVYETTFIMIEIFNNTAQCVMGMDNSYHYYCYVCYDDKAVSVDVEVMTLIMYSCGV